MHILCFKPRGKCKLLSNGCTSSQLFLLGYFVKLIRDAVELQVRKKAICLRGKLGFQRYVLPAAATHNYMSKFKHLASKAGYGYLVLSCKRYKGFTKIGSSLSKLKQYLLKLSIKNINKIELDIFLTC